MAIFNNTEFYRDAFIKYGVSPKGVHWNSKHTQEIRFKILLEFIQNDIENSKIVDAGCGFGDLINYFASKFIFPKKYIGIDREDFFIEVASTIYPNATFKQIDILKDPLPKSDYYLCSGAMNTLELNEVQTFIEKCFESSTKGFVFNFLKEDTFNGITKDDILNLCKTISNNIETKEGYLNNDFTIFMVK